MSEDTSKTNDISSARPDRSSFLSTLFRRSFSLQPQASVDENEFVIGHTTNRRTRGYSESSLDEFDLDQGSNTFQANHITRRRSATEVDGNASSLQGNAGRPRSLTLSAMLLGTRLPTTNEDSASRPSNNIFSSMEQEVNSEKEFSSENKNTDLFIENSGPANQNRETCQTDHLNKKLLDSFLTRINSVAANIIDPSGRGENMGQVYTDDVMMDRIIRRVESEKK